MLEEIATLEEAYNPMMDFKAFRAKHIKVRQDCVTGRQPISELNKINYLLNSVSGDPSLIACSEQYFSRNPEMRNKHSQDYLKSWTN